jgi:hypothetical protein
MRNDWKLVIFSLGLVGASFLIAAPGVARAASHFIGVPVKLHLGSVAVASKGSPVIIVQSKYGTVGGYGGSKSGTWPQQQSKR